jgi:hypothetical protein
MVFLLQTGNQLVADWLVGQLVATLGQVIDTG